MAEVTMPRLSDTMEEGTSLEDAQRFVEHHLKADELYDLFVSIRAACYEESKRRKRR